MPQFMKHRDDIIETDQRRLALSRTRYVHHIDDHRRLIEQRGLADNGIHPCTSTLGFTFVIVGIKQAERFAGFIENIKNTNRWVVDR